jgi:uncharacterized protein (TIGR03118 family)
MIKTTLENWVPICGKTKTTVAIAAIGLFLLINPGCKKDSNTSGYQVVKLVADAAGSGAAIVDANLVNPWGIAVGYTGSLWIASNEKGFSAIYDRNGATLLSPVAIPANGIFNGGKPTGVVYNSTTDFTIPTTSEKSKFIFAEENGTIAAWSSGSSAITVIDRSLLGAVYKGITMGTVGNSNFIYAANFKGRKIDVFDSSFNNVNMSFADSSIPADFGPFNIQNINSSLFVTYAKLKLPDNKDDESGVGNGFVNVFSTAGVFLYRFATQGTLNSPWAVVQAPSSFGLGSNIILVGNFGDGRVNAYERSSGAYKGQLKDGDNTIAIDGLWGLAFPQNNIPAGDQNQLFFTAGTAAKNHGLFGYIKIK